MYPEPHVAGAAIDKSTVAEGSIPNIPSTTTPSWLVNQRLIISRFASPARHPIKQQKRRGGG